MSAHRLSATLKQYESALTLISQHVFEQSTSQVSSQLVLDVLLARDEIERIRSEDAKQNQTSFHSQDHIKIIQLDQQLKDSKEIISKYGNLSLARKSVQPEDDAWWWFLEENSSQKTNQKSNRFDWVWNGVTVVFLVMATSFATSTAKAFAIQGFDLLGIFSSFMQGAGLVFVASGTFTEKGKKSIQNALSSVGISEQYHTEATCLLSFSLLIASLAGYSNLYRLGNVYYEWGRQERLRGDNISAYRSFQKSLDFAPDKKETYAALGQVTEKMGRLEEATTYYEQGLAYYEQGLALQGASSAIGLARVNLISALRESDWTSAIDPEYIRKVEFHLGLASQFNTGFDDNGEPREVVDVIIEHYTHLGLLELARADLKSFNFSETQFLSTEDVDLAELELVQEKLDKALNNLLRAHWEEMEVLAIYGEGSSKQRLLRYSQLTQRAVEESDSSISYLRVRKNTERLARANFLAVFRQLTYEERNQILDEFIKELSATEVQSLKETVIFDMGKPRCYIAIVHLLRLSINESLEQRYESDPIDFDLVLDKRDVAEQECGDTTSASSEDIFLSSNKLDLYSLSLYDKTLMSKLLDVTHNFVPKTEE